MITEKDLFGNTTEVKERTLKDPVLVRGDVCGETELAIQLAERSTNRTEWIPKKLCLWNGSYGPARLAVERMKAEELGWDYERV